MSAPVPDPPPGSPSGALTGSLAGLLGAAGVLVIGAFALLQAPAGMAPGRAVPVRPAGQACASGADGFFRGRFFGAVDFEAAWSGAALTCDGMERTDGQGVRLFFAGDRPGGGRVSVLIGLDGQPAGLAGTEQAANVTVIDESDGRFFSSAGPGRCWANVASVTTVAASPAGPAGRRVEGLVYCVGALPSVGDRASLTLGDLQFSGWIAADAD